MKRKRIRVNPLTGLLPVLLSLSAQAGISYSYTDSGDIPHGGNVFSVEQTINGIGSSMGSLELVLTFNDCTSLSGDSTGIEGRLVLGTSANSPYIQFFPAATCVSEQSRIYDVTFSGAPGSPGVGFSGSNPNATWCLVLWDNSTSPVQNELNGWSLNIEAVPEPVNEALSVSAGALILAAAVRHRRLRERLRRCQIAAG
jgi:hypothetical protein